MTITIPLANGHNLHVAESDPGFAGLLVAYVTGPQATRSAALAAAVSLCGGGTAIECRGGWNGPDGPIIEPCTRLEVAFRTPDDGRRLLEVLAENARQGGQSHFMYHVTMCNRTLFNAICEPVT